MERHREGFLAEVLKWDILQQRGSCGLDAGESSLYMTASTRKLTILLSTVMIVVFTVDFSRGKFPAHACIFRCGWNIIDPVYNL